MAWVCKYLVILDVMDRLKASTIPECDVVCRGIWPASSDRKEITSLLLDDINPTDPPPFRISLAKGNDERSIRETCFHLKQSFQVADECAQSTFICVRFVWDDRLGNCLDLTP